MQKCVYLNEKIIDRSRKELFRAKDTLLGILGFHSRDETAMLVHKTMAKRRSSLIIIIIIIIIESAT